MAGPEDEDFDVGLGEPYDLGGFFYGEIFAITQPEDFKLPGWQDGACFFPEIGLCVLCLGRLVRGKFGGRQVFRDGFEGFGGAEMVEGVVARNRQQPMDERAAQIQPCQVVESFEEGLLGEVFGVLAVPGHLFQEPKYPGVINAHDPAESVRVAAEHLTDGVCVVGGDPVDWVHALGHCRRHRS